MEKNIINLNKGLFETIQEVIKKLPIGESRKKVICKDGVYDALIIVDDDGTFCYTADKVDAAIKVYAKENRGGAKWIN